MTGGAATWALARLALVRATRGKALYLAAATVLMPVILCSVRVGLGHDRLEIWDMAFELTLLLLPIVPPILIGPALADELEDRTAAYLWSRPLPRWSIVLGKLAGLAPMVALIMAGALAIAWAIVGGPGAVPADHALRYIAGAAAGGLAASCVVAALATLIPRHTVPTAVFFLIVDAALGRLPLKVASGSVTYGASALAGYVRGELATGVISLIVIAALAIGIALRRISTLEG